MRILNQTLENVEKLGMYCEILHLIYCTEYFNFLNHVVLKFQAVH